jgi:hypothetical protein
LGEPGLPAPSVTPAGGAHLGEASREIAALVPALRATADKYAARLEAQILQLAAELRARAALPATERDRRDLARILEELRALDLRPERGRRKDLKRIERFLDRAWRLAERW